MEDLTELSFPCVGFRSCVGLCGGKSCPDHDNCGGVRVRAASQVQRRDPRRHGHSTVVSRLPPVRGPGREGRLAGGLLVGVILFVGVILCLGVILSVGVIFFVGVILFVGAILCVGVTLCVGVILCVGFILCLGAVFGETW